MLIRQSETRAADDPVRQSRSPALQECSRHMLDHIDLHPRRCFRRGIADVLHGDQGFFHAA